MSVAASLPGAAKNIKRNAYEVSQTLETVRALRTALGVDKHTFASYCTPEVLRWARVAGRSEEVVNEMHRKLETGWKAQLPWTDTRAGTPAGDEAGDDEVEYTPEGIRVYAYRIAYNHQEIMASVCLSLDGIAIMGEVGTGKTRAAIESFGHLLRSGQLDVVVVCGKKATLANVWKDELKTWARDLTPVLLDGTVPERAAVIRRIAAGERVCAAGQFPVVLLNHDVLSRLEDDLTRLSGGLRVGLVIDESQKMRNPDAKVTQSGMRLAGCSRWRLIMTGSPVIQGEQDVFSQWYIVDLGVTFGANFVQFRREWLVENPYTMKVTARDEDAQTEIGLRMRRRGYRVTKEQGIPDLPPRVYEQMPIELTREQEKAYSELQEQLITELQTPDESGRYATAANQLTMIQRLLSVTSGFVKDDRGAIHRFSPNPKLNALKELVEENIGNGSIIVWAWYREDVERIARELIQYTPSIVYGGQSHREDMIRAFTERRTRLLIANQASGGVGLNLQVAPLAIYYSQGYNLEDRLQSEGRNHRGGSQIHRQVTYIDLIAQGTIDEVVLAALKRKKSVADVVVDLRRAIGAQT